MILTAAVFCMAEWALNSRHLLVPFWSALLEKFHIQTFCRVAHFGKQPCDSERCGGMGATWTWTASPSETHLTWPGCQLLGGAGIPNPRPSPSMICYSWWAVLPGMCASVCVCQWWIVLWILFCRGQWLCHGTVPAMLSLCFGFRSIATNLCNICLSSHIWFHEVWCWASFQ